MRRPPERCPAWPEVWVEAMEVHADDWNDGTIGRAEVFASLAERSGMSVADVETHARGAVLGSSSIGTRGARRPSAASAKRW